MIEFKPIEGKVAEAVAKHGGDEQAATAFLVKRAIPDALEILERTRANGRYDYTNFPPLPEILIKKAKGRGDGIWEGSHAYTNPGVPVGTEVQRLDTNAAFLSALNTNLPIGVLEHREEGEFDKSRSGAYLIEPPRWEHPELPNPIGNRLEKGPLWVTRPTLQLLIDAAGPRMGQLCETPIIYESWTSGGTESLLRKFKDVLTSARTRALVLGDDVTMAYIKAMYSKFVSTAGESTYQREFRRPDWLHIIRAQAFANLWRKSFKAHAAGLAVYRAVGTDELHVVGEWRSVWNEGKALSEMKLKDIDGDGGVYTVEAKRGK